MKKKLTILPTHVILSGEIDTERRVENYIQFSKMTALERYCYVNKKGEVPSYTVAGIKEKEGKNVFYICHNDYAKSLKGYYPIKTFIMYNNRCSTTKFTIRDALIKLGFNWLNEFKDVYNCEFLTPANVRAIVNGEITNCKDLIHRYTYRCIRKKVSVKTYIKFTKCFPISAALYVDNVEMFAEKYCSSDYEARSVLRDIFELCHITKTVVSYKWSFNRITEEHLKITRDLMKLSLEAKDAENIVSLSCNYKGIIPLINEQLVYEEGFTMHHCLYTNYWSKIRNYEYFAVRYLKGSQPITIGYEVDWNGGDYSVCLDQYFYKYDLSLSPEDKDLISKDEELRNVVNEYKSVINTNHLSLQQSLIEKSLIF